MEHDVTRFENYFFRLEKEIKKHTSGISGCFTRFLFKKAKKMALKELEKMEKTRYNENFIKDEKVRERFKDFYSSAVYEIDEIKAKYCTDIPVPTRMIFGHTHQPIPWGTPPPDAPSMKPGDLSQLPEGKEFIMYNSGGWLNYMDEETNKLKFSGAEIFFYEPIEGFTSESVGYTFEKK